MEALFAWLPTATLFAMMLAMGMTLAPADFARVIQRPRAFACGLLGQLVALPILALASISVFGLAGPMAIGVLLIAACPGGVTSNAMAHYARGDSALSVSLTAVSSSLAFLTVPLVVSIGLRMLQSSEAQATDAPPVQLSFIQTAGTLLASTLAPIAIGMLVRTYSPSLAARLSGPLLAVSTSVLTLLLVGLGGNLAASESDIAGLFAATGLALAALICGLLVVTHVSGRLLRLPAVEVRTLELELSLQNVNLALVIANSLIGDPRVAGPAVVYLPLMLLVGGLLILRGRFHAARETAPTLAPQPGWTRNAAG